MKKFALVAAATAIAVLGAAPAVANQKSDLENEKFKGGDKTEFEGSCEIRNGRVLYTRQPLQTDEEELTFEVKADARCEGTLDGNEKTFDAKLNAFGIDPFGCEAGSVFGPIPGELNPEPDATDDDDNNIAVVIENEPNPVTIMNLEGRNGGTASGPFTLEDNPDPVEFLQRCQGDGNEVIEFEGMLDTGDNPIAG